MKVVNIEDSRPMHRRSIYIEGYSRYNWCKKKGWSTNIQPPKHQESMHYDILGLAKEHKLRNNKTSKLVNVPRC